MKFISKIVLFSILGTSLTTFAGEYNRAEYARLVKSYSFGSVTIHSGLQCGYCVGKCGYETATVVIDGANQGSGWEEIKNKLLEKVTSEICVTEADKLLVILNELKNRSGVAFESFVREMNTDPQGAGNF